MTIRIRNHPQILIRLAQISYGPFVALGYGVRTSKASVSIGNRVTLLQFPCILYVSGTRFFRTIIKKDNQSHYQKHIDQYFSNHVFILFFLANSFKVIMTVHA